VGWVCRGLGSNSLTGPLPTELGMLTALTNLCVRRPHPPRLDACAVTGLWAEYGGGSGCRFLSYNSLTGTLPTELGAMDALTSLYVRHPHPPRPDACTVTGLWAEYGGGVGCRWLYQNSLTGPLPTELGTMDAMAYLCVRRPHPPCLDACAVTGLWAEHGGGVGEQISTREQSHGAAADRAGHHGLADQAVRVPPSPTVPGRVRRHRVVG
jgi:hypothetical protein